MSEQTDAAVCRWTEDSNEDDATWWTECDQGFSFIDGGPVDNNMAYCCYCGRRLEEVRYAAPADMVVNESIDAFLASEAVKLPRE